MRNPASVELNLKFGASSDLLAELLDSNSFSSIHILCDENTRVHCLPRLNYESWSVEPQVIQMGAGEEYKTLETCVNVWDQLVEAGADRSSLVISVGGGVVTDLGGFVAASFMSCSTSRSFPHSS